MGPKILFHVAVGLLNSKRLLKSPLQLIVRGRPVPGALLMLGGHRNVRALIMTVILIQA